MLTNAKNNVALHGHTESPFATPFDTKMGINWNCISDWLVQRHSALHLVSNTIPELLQHCSVPLWAIKHQSSNEHNPEALSTD